MIPGNGVLSNLPNIGMSVIGELPCFVPLDNAFYAKAPDLSSEDSIVTTRTRARTVPDGATNK